jgi:hypothetical protein
VTEKEEDEKLGKATIAEGMRTIRAVDARARSCRKPACRRHGMCVANPYLNRNARTGGCPITSREEWRTINCAIHIAMNRAFRAIDAVTAETGETFSEGWGRLATQAPPARWNRRIAIAPMRRD